MANIDYATWHASQQNTQTNWTPLYYSAIPLGRPSGGTIGNNGALTLTTPFATIYPYIWLYFPENAVYSGSPSGIYYVRMSSTTSGIIYDNVYLSGTPSNITSPTSFVTTGPGAYTQALSAEITLYSNTLPGNLLGINGKLKGIVDYSSNGSITNAKTLYTKLGGAIIHRTDHVSVPVYGEHFIMSNRGAANNQVSNRMNTSVGNTSSSATLVYNAIDTTVAQPLIITAIMAVNTDWVIIETLCYETLALDGLGDQFVDVTVGDTAKQSFMGFGASQPMDQDRLFSVYGAPKVTALSNAVYRDLGMDWIRLWVHAELADTLAVMKAEFYAGYIDNGYLNIIKSSGATNIILAPTVGESAPTQTMAAYAQKVAQFILDIYTERGVRVDVTGIANEPQGFTPTQLSDAARLLRAELNSRGLTSVSIIGPESASADDTAVNAINGIKSNPTSWAALLGVATHSYNMGACFIIEDTIVGTGKQYWMTEAGQCLPLSYDEQPGNTPEASSVAARFLSDMNNAVTHWMWFIGIGHYDSHPNNDSGQYLARPNDTTGGIKYNSEYYYLKQLRAAFNIGAVFHEAIDPTGPRKYEQRMTWSYGAKPAITVAMAKNPTGFWGIGIVNTTGITNNGKYAMFCQGKNYQTAIKVPTDALGKVFQVYRSRSDGLGYDMAERLTPNKYGRLIVTVAPCELVTLLSQ